MEEPWFQSLLSCPDCEKDLARSASEYTCTACDFRCKATAPLDLRPHHPRPVTLTFTPRPLADLPQDLGKFVVERPKVSVDGPRALRDSRELLSAMVPFLHPGASVLDLGCGPRDQYGPIHHLGWQYVGADFDNQAADVLADAHALPFRDGAFDAILSYAVLEHMSQPYLAVHEAKRALRPGGIYCGTVSQGEPFHSSFFHMTAWGVASLFEGLGLEILRLWPSYDTLLALAEMGRYPRVIKALLHGIGKLHNWLPFLAPRQMKWPPRQKCVEELYRSGSVCFLARKPG